MLFAAGQGPGSVDDRPPTPILIYCTPESPAVKEDMADNFWTGVIVGWLVGLILGFLLPVIGPLVGGFVAGWMSGRGIANGAKAGLLAGILGAIVIAALLLIGGTVLLGAFGFIAGLGTSLVIIVMAFVYQGLLSLIGGVIAGAIRR